MEDHTAGQPASLPLPLPLPPLLPLPLLPLLLLPLLPLPLPLPLLLPPSLRGRSWLMSRKFGMVMALAEEARRRRETRRMVVLEEDRRMRVLCGTCIEVEMEAGCVVKTEYLYKG